MNNFLLFLTVLFLINSAQAFEVPENPPNACYEGCTSYMKNLLHEFETVGVLPSTIPSVYSGICYHLGVFDSQTEHHAVVLLDQVKQALNFSTIFSFFSETNEFATWNVEQAQKEMSPYWKEHGSVITENKTARVVVTDENLNPVYVYWFRQNPVTQDLLYITYAGVSMKSFCRLQKNANSSLSNR